MNNRYEITAHPTAHLGNNDPRREACDACREQLATVVYTFFHAASWTKGSHNLCPTCTSQWIYSAADPESEQYVGRE